MNCYRKPNCNTCEQIDANLAPSFIIFPFLFPLLDPLKICAMAEVVPSSPTGNADEGACKSKAGRQSRFSNEEDLILVREVAASSAHLAAFGETRATFGQAAAKVNENEAMKEKVTWKSVRDRYKKIQEKFDKRDNCERRISGSGGEVGEMDELLMEMKQARDDILAQKACEKTAQRERDDEKDQIGRELLASGSKHKEEESRSASDDEKMRSARKKVKTKGLRVDSSMDMAAAFSLNLRDADLARVELDRERLQFERERSKATTLSASANERSEMRSARRCRS